VQVDTETCKHQPVYFGAVNININERTIGSVDVWRCGVCKKRFCEEKQLGIESIADICQLAREAQICYVSISTVTDYDVWAEKPVTAKEVIEMLSKNIESTKKLLAVLIDEIPKSRECNCEKALAEAEF